MKVTDGLSDYLPQLTLKGRLDKGETPLTPSYTDTKRDIAIVSAEAGANRTETGNSHDDNELSEWANDGRLSTAWITYTLAESYPLEVYAGDELIWSGNTEKSLGYVHLEVDKPVCSDKITVRLKGSTTDKDAFGQIVEVAGGAANDMEKKAKEGKGKHNLRIIEIEFLESIKKTSASPATIL